jgi:hypothetical protein
MSSRRIAPTLLVVALAGAIALVAGPFAAGAGAQGLEWRLEQPEPPEAPAGAQGSEICHGSESTNCHRTPVGLGRVGDMEFWSPNRGLLITAGNGTTIPPGVWAYNGEGWHELASECGASDGRIAWAGADEFWTVSDGRPGQAANGQGLLPPLEDNTLCRFSGGSIVDSYAAPGFQASSYQAMHAAACTSSSDCWFAGDPLPSPQPGAFHLHWNGHTLEAEPNTSVHAVQDMRVFGGSLYESIALPLEEANESEHTLKEILHPSVLEEIAPEGTFPTFVPQEPTTTASRILPEYAFKSFPRALSFLHLSADEESLWAAAGPVVTPPAKSEPAALTVLREAGGEWSQVLGPPTTQSVAIDPPEIAEDVVSSVAAEPGSSSAWLALDTHQDVAHPSPTATARLEQVSADGSVAEAQLPSSTESGEGVGPKGAAYKVACPAQNDCWAITTQGWLFHLSEAADRKLAPDTDPAFNGPLITFRPPDQGLPQVQSDTLPIDTSGLEESQLPNTEGLITKATATNLFATATVPLLSHLRTRLIHGSTLELSFHLAVEARIRLVAKRHSSVVASTPTRTLKAGSRSLQLRLNPHRWPTKLSLQTHALAPLPTASSRGRGVETVSTSLVFPTALGTVSWGPSL